MVYIYILQLENNKYYIGKTLNPEFILDTLSKDDSKDSEWIQMNKPIRLHELIPKCEDYDEDLYTKIYMNKYGIDNVRGGQYKQIILNDATIKHLKHITNNNNKLYSDSCSSYNFTQNKIHKTNFACNRCYKRRHTDRNFIYNNNNIIDEQIDTNKQNNNKIICIRCNRKGHTEINCYAKTNINKELLIVPDNSIINNDKHEELNKNDTCLISPCCNMTDNTDKDSLLNNNEEINNIVCSHSETSNNDEVNIYNQQDDDNLEYIKLSNNYEKDNKIDNYIEQNRIIKFNLYNNIINSSAGKCNLM
uniref:GIY-YIG domain-containing protein n=1 Tax=viral metagenome TaxID=1070528 RepID=A0A6C0H8M4_9ZZZZ